MATIVVTGNKAQRDEAKALARAFAPLCLTDTTIEIELEPEHVCVRLSGHGSIRLSGHRGQARDVERMLGEIPVEFRRPGKPARPVAQPETPTAEPPIAELDASAAEGAE